MRELNRQTERQVNTHRDKQTDKESDTDIDRQTDEHTYTDTRTHTDTHTHTHTHTPRYLFTYYCYPSVDTVTSLTLFPLMFVVLQHRLNTPGSIQHADPKLETSYVMVPH